RTIRWKRGAVQIEAAFLDQPFTASAARAIITLPLGVLQAPAGSQGAVSFEPPLACKRQALDGLAFGPVLKLSLRFRRAFWDEIDRGKYREASFFHSADPPIHTFWTTLPLRSPLLTAWIAGPAAAKLSTASMQELVGLSLSSLSAVFSR